MKITDVELDCHCRQSVSGLHFSDFTFMFFRGPASFRLSGRETGVSTSSAVICSSGSRCFFRPLGCETLIYDKVSFKLSPSELREITETGFMTDEPVPLGETVSVRALLKCMQEFLSASEKLRDELLEDAFRLILKCITDRQSDEYRRKKSEIPHFAKLEALREKIYSNPSERWNIDELCSELAVSRTYFHRIYLAAFGVTCIQDVIDSRISHASKMLRESKMSVSSIAEYCGYDSDSFFMRQFKKNTGFTPTEYRRLYAKNHAFDSDDENA